MATPRRATVGTHSAAVIVGVVLGFIAAWVNKHPTVQNFIDKEAIAIREFGFSCGVERWSVKTLADGPAIQVNFIPSRATVPTLISAPNPHPSARLAPVETQVWQLTGVRVVAFKQEPDSDIHLKLQSVLPGHPTMIAEIPLASCVTPNMDARVRAQQLRIGTARAALLNYVKSKFGLVLTGSYQTVSFQATIQGVGFFDFDHGQNGVAPNAIELHPVLNFVGW